MGGGWSKKPKGKFRSRFEETIDQDLADRKVKRKYEVLKIQYVQPAVEKYYIPDWILSNGIIIEAKGRWTTDDRKKHVWIKEQFPELDIRFIFQNPNQKIRKGSKTSYGQFATKHGIMWAEKIVPEEWIMEPERDLNLFKKRKNKDGFISVSWG